MIASIASTRGAHCVEPKWRILQILAAAAPPVVWESNHDQGPSDALRRHLLQDTAR